MAPQFRGIGKWGPSCNAGIRSGTKRDIHANNLVDMQQSEQQQKMYIFSVATNLSVFIKTHILSWMMNLGIVK